MNRVSVGSDLWYFTIIADANRFVVVDAKIRLGGHKETPPEI